MLWLQATGCGSGSRALSVEQQARRARLSQRLAGAAGDSTYQLPEYRIGLLDELEVRVEFHERFNELVKVRPDGRITLVSIGDLYVLGMTPSELDRIITRAYARLVRDPEVTVFVREFGGRVIYVFGEVDKPGIFELQPGMTILQAIASAGGPIRGAKLNSVMLIRQSATGSPEAYRYDLSRKALHHGEEQDDVLLPRDIVYVPRTTIADINDFLSQFYSAILPPLDTYLRALREYGRR